MTDRPIHIIGYPTNKASSGGISGPTPYAFEKIVQPHIAGQYGVEKKFDMVEVYNDDAETENGVNHYASVHRSVERLFAEQCKKMWAGGVNITIGGDHSQGLPTIKSALFVSVLRELTSDKNDVLSASQKSVLKNLAHNGGFIDASRTIDDLALMNGSVKDEIVKVVNKVHVIWIDAHGDFNTKVTSSSGNFHGMSLAAACGLDAGGLEDVGGKFVRANAKNVHIMCARDLDEKEERLLKRFAVDFERFEMSDSRRGKIRAKGQPITAKSREFDVVFANLVHEIKEKGGKIVLSMDIDHLPFPETGTPLGAEENVRKNRYNQSPTGPLPADTYSSYSNLAHDESFIAFDITEIALSYISSKTGRKVVGAKAFRGGVNILGSLLGGDEARLKLFRALKKEGNLVRRFKELGLA